MTTSTESSPDPRDRWPEIRLRRVELFPLAMPLRGDFATSFGRVRHREMVIVRIEDESGAVGFGEAPVASRPHYSAETTTTAVHVLKDWIAPSVLGRSFTSVPEFLAAFDFVRGHRMARAAMEWALLDLGCKKLELPLQSWLGATAPTASVGVSLGIPAGQSVSALLDTVARYVDLGYGRVKLKLQRGFCEEPARAVRERFPDLRLVADANGGFTIDDVHTLRKLDEVGLIYLEQPIRPYDLCDHARLRTEIATPICLDESVESLADLESALALGAIDILNLKPGRVGGPSEALRILTRCQEASIPVWCGGMLETGIGRAAPRLARRLLVGSGSIRVGPVLRGRSGRPRLRARPGQHARRPDRPGPGPRDP
ncbi:MAG: o-succinylbenzoate synthase [Planctomycetota bacterium]